MYSKRELVAKRLFDVAASAAGVVAAAPLLVATAALVKLSSPGPVIFRQQRVGKGGKPFELWKFRTMRPATGGPLVTAGGDSRITPIGRLLRKSKLDELPELLNVLKGDLSLVGPRPEVPRYVALYPERERTFLQQIRPGITDPATVRGPDLAFVSSPRLPSGPPERGFLAFAPDLCVEIISPSNTSVEIHEKVLDYLEAGTGAVWVVHPEARTVTEYLSPTEIRILSVTDELDGGEILPRFRIPVASLFPR